MSSQLGGGAAGGENGEAERAAQAADILPRHGGSSAEPISDDARTLLARAARAYEFGERMRTSTDASTDAAGLLAAAEQYIEAIHSVLAARAPGAGDSARERLFEQHAAELSGRFNRRAPGFSAILSTLDFAALARVPVERLRALVPHLAAVAAELIVEARAPIVAEQRAQTMRALIAFAALFAILAFSTGMVLSMVSKPNLAQGAAWSTSSVFAHCDPVAKRCGGVATAVFFHTREEDNPWFEYDFGRPLRFSSLTIMNRSDAVQERAVPLIVEVSNDRKTYREIARRSQVFQTWQPQFVPQTARYLRLRVARRSFLHLDGVEVHP